MAADTILPLKFLKYQDVLHQHRLEHKRSVKLVTIYCDQIDPTQKKNAIQVQNSASNKYDENQNFFVN